MMLSYGLLDGHIDQNICNEFSEDVKENNDLVHYTST